MAPSLPVLRIGFVGSGFIARFHLNALLGVRNVVVTGVYSPTREKRQALAALTSEKLLRIVPDAGHLFEEPGALESVTEMACAWFQHYLAPAGREAPPAAPPVGPVPPERIIAAGEEDRRDSGPCAPERTQGRRRNAIQLLQQPPRSHGSCDAQQ